MARDNKVEIEIILKGAAAAKGIKAFAHDAQGGLKQIKTGAESAGKGLGILGKEVDGLGGRFSALKTLAIGAFTAIITYAGAKLVNSFIDVASSVENYRVRLSTLLGSQRAAAEAMQFFNDIAAKSPATLGEVIEAGTTLVAMGADYKKWIPVLNDLAAVMGMKLPEAAAALGRAYAGGAGAADIFRERGILNVIKDFAKLKYGINDITKVELPEFQKIMYETFTAQGGRIAGAGEELAKTWTGKISMMKDAWFQFRQEVMGSGLFEALKIGLDVVLARLDEMKKSGDLKRVATEVGATVLEVIATVIEHAGKIPAITAAIGKAVATVGAVTVAFGEAFIKVFFFWASWKDEAVAAIQEAGVGLATLARDIDKIGPDLAGWAPKAKAAADELRKMADEARTLQKVHDDVARGGDELGTGYEEAAQETKATAKQLTYVLDGVEKVVGETENATANFVQLKAAADEIPKSLDAGAKKIKEENELLREQIRLLQQAAQTARPTGVQSFTPASEKYGGILPSFQGGGIMPGFSSSDKYLAKFRAGEAFLSPESVNYYGKDFVQGLIDRAIPREVTGRQGYMVVDFRLGQKSFPITAKKEDVLDEFLKALHRAELIQG